MVVRVDSTVETSASVDWATPIVSRRVRFADLCAVVVPVNA